MEDLNAVNDRCDDRLWLMIEVRTHSMVMNTMSHSLNRKMVLVDKVHRQLLVMQIGYYLLGCHEEIHLIHTANGKKRIQLEIIEHNGI